MFHVEQAPPIPSLQEGSGQGQSYLWHVFFLNQYFLILSLKTNASREMKQRPSFEFFCPIIEIMRQVFGECGV